MKVVYIYNGKVLGEREGRFILCTPLPGDLISISGDVEDYYLVEYRKWVFAPGDGFSYPTVIEIYLRK
jgi:hypothetical protein